MQTETFKPFTSELPFQPDEHYSPKDVAKRKIAAEQTLAQWRHMNKGPAYIKSGSRVLYRGSDLLKWLSDNHIQTQAA